MEGRRARPRGVMGLFDPSARPWVKPDVLTFAVPMAKLTRMIDDMEESFLSTRTWDRLKARMGEG
jgi:hypothetical protein